MDILVLQVGMLQVNCYILISNNEALVIDPGGDSALIVEQLKNEKAQLKTIAITHSHYDHIGAVDELLTEYPDAVFVAHEAEADYPASAAKNLSYLMGMSLSVSEPTSLLKEGDEINIGNSKCTVLHVPGHSVGSVCFYFAEEEVVFTGDALFQGSIGRTDFPGGDHELLINSIRKKLLTLPENTIALPGHGGKTAIGTEIISNPYL